MRLFVIIAFLSSIAFTAASQGEYIYQGAQFTLYPDRVVEAEQMAWTDDGIHIYSNHREVLTKEKGEILETPQAGKVAKRGLYHQLTGLPQFNSPFPLINACYKMALDDTMRNIKSSSGWFGAGSIYGLWTRDTAYSILLGEIIPFPKECLRSIEGNFHEYHDWGDKLLIRLEQYPAMTDCVSLIPAIWEYYLWTGDRGVIEKYYDAMVATVERMEQEQLDPKTGLFYGGCSFMDNPTAYPSGAYGNKVLSFSNNVLYSAAYKTLAKCARLLGRDASEVRNFEKRAQDVASRIDKYFWIPEKGYYAQLIYQGKMEERFEALGEMLGIVLDVVPPTKAASIIANEPDLEYGLPTVFPVYTGNPYYHNLSIWPFIQGFWAWGANVVENEKALLKALAVQTRLAALELTFKELSRMETGDGTNADYQLWSAAGYLCTIYRGLFGMKLQEDGILFHPLIPKKLAGEYRLEGIKYRDAILNITLEGQGNMVSAFYIDGKKQEKPFFPADLSGKHEIKIIVSPLPVTCPKTVLPTSKFTVTVDTSKLCIEKPLLEYCTSSMGKARFVKPSKEQDGKYLFFIESPRLTSTQYQLFIRLANMNKPYNVVRIIPPVQMEVPKEITFNGLEEARRGKELKITLKNNKDTSVNTTIRYFLPRGWQISPKPEPVSLAPGQECELTFTISSQTAPFGVYKSFLRASAYPILTHTVEFTLEDSMNLAGKWLFKVGDNPVYAKPEYDDSDWMLIKVPARWEDEGIDFFELSTVKPYEGPYNGYAWYRLHVVVPEEWEGYNLLLVMGAIDDSDVTYWNGQLVGQTGSEKYTAWCASRQYIIPKEFIRYGAENIIAVRVYDGGGAGGIWQDPVMLKVPAGK